MFYVFCLLDPNMGREYALFGWCHFAAMDPGADIDDVFKP